MFSSVVWWFNIQQTQVMVRLFRDHVARWHFSSHGWWHGWQNGGDGRSKKWWNVVSTLEATTAPERSATTAAACVRSSVRVWPDVYLSSFPVYTFRARWEKEWPTERPSSSSLRGLKLCHLIQSPSLFSPCSMTSTMRLFCKSYYICRLCCLEYYSGRLLLEAFSN